MHKKEEKTLIKNYNLISLLPIFGKIFEMVICNSLFNHFLSNKLFVPSQSGFIPGDSSIAQFLSIIHEIQTAFDNNATTDVRDVFLDVSKAFDKVWHDGLIFMLKSYGFEGEFLSLLKSYLQNCEQRVGLNGQTSGPLLFLIYINDLPARIISLCKAFADDTSLFSKALDMNKYVTELNTDLDNKTSMGLSVENTV